MINHSDIFNFALALSKGQSEIDWRNSIARAYYASFHFASEIQVTCPRAEQSFKGEHEKLARRFELHGSRDGKAIASALKAMKRYRTMADYELERDVKQSDALNQIESNRMLTRRLVSFRHVQVSK